MNQSEYFGSQDPLRRSHGRSLILAQRGTIVYQVHLGLPANMPILHIHTLPAAALKAPPASLSGHAR